MNWKDVIWVKTETMETFRFCSEFDFLVFFVFLQSGSTSTVTVTVSPSIVNISTDLTQVIRLQCGALCV